MKLIQFVAEETEIFFHVMERFFHLKKMFALP